MTKAAHTSRTNLRHFVVALALLAACFKAFIPSGYMLGKANADAPFAMVMCTADSGPLVEHGSAPHHDDSAGKLDHQPCPFAGFAVSAPPPSPLPVETVSFAAYSPIAEAAAPSVAPGRGLAAPPLPARGPPSLLT